MQQKLLDFQEMYDSYQRYIQLGKKFDGLAKDFSNNKKKKLLVDELMKMVITENVKRQPAPKKLRQKSTSKNKVKRSN
ncbi:recombination inhibitory protein MutS2 [Nonlabens ulvanivorans]|uniref:Recombination inhibitory protein MutS2 n=1 Tax=Nonlabens ulvanivorans TaxID=906888 RepID=A0A090QEY2_NONUL|nr:recombination inhibitory protein MutS2 [Nonlabens ulvanivorans]